MVFPIRIGVSLALVACSNASLADVKPDPGDYTPLPAGTRMALVYQQNPSGDEVYQGGHKVADDADVRLTVGVLRLVQFSQFLDTGYIWDPQIIIPFGRQTSAADDSRHAGLGDITAGATLWTLADPERNEYLGWSAFVTAPTGADKNDGFALSNNRWALDLQVGYTKGLADRLTWEVIAESEFYSRQRSTDAATAPLLQLHNHLRYDLTSQTYAAVSYRHNWGARQTRDGETLGTSQSNGSLGLSVATLLNKNWQFMGQWQRDLTVRQGLKVDQSLQLRLAFFY